MGVGTSCSPTLRHGADVRRSVAPRGSLDRSEIDVFTNLQGIRVGGVPVIAVIGATLVLAIAGAGWAMTLKRTA